MNAKASLEQIIKDKEAQAQKILDEVNGIKSQMRTILSEPPPPPVSRLMEAFSEGVRSTLPPGTSEPVLMRIAAEREVIFAAMAIVRSWERRHKKNWHSQEKELMNAVKRLTWDV